MRIKGKKGKKAKRFFRSTALKLPLKIERVRRAGFGKMRTAGQTRFSPPTAKLLFVNASPARRITQSLKMLPSCVPILLGVFSLLKLGKCVLRHFKKFSPEEVLPFVHEVRRSADHARRLTRQGRWFFYLLTGAGSWRVVWQPCGLPWSRLQSCCELLP